MRELRIYAFSRHTLLSATSLTSVYPERTIAVVKPDPNTTPERDLGSILRRIELGDSSVTDLVYWLQMQESFTLDASPTPDPSQSQPSEIPDEPR